ncbi:serine/threonine-protein kinase [uncultured Eubacterium sp.]|uniref:serine/threonine-protein kinase n=1 Tax=Eubacterium sp. TaxID=142586 RepID=UPI0025D9EAEC|nr:serine/threonine-protein kinase [uncultured Eubacterium sp.]
MDSILGRTILGYNVIEKIGSGGFGDVYKVERSNIVGKTTRALKVITLPRDDEYLEILNSMGGDKNKTNAYFEKELNRVVNEIRVFSLISEKDNHNIVSYYENDVEQISEYRYNIYILMELLTPLNKWLQQNNITVEDGLNIGIGIANGLAICHKNNIVHRDIKLSNIFVSKDGAFKLGDFGVSKNITNATMAHTIKGTPNYIAPEIYIGKSKYDNTVDIYSLGILMYYLFNKKRFPYYPEYPKEYTREDEDKAFYKRMQYDKLPNPLEAPDSITKIIKKAVSKSDERYQSAVAIEKDLIVAKSKLSEKQLSRQIGFEPVFADNNKIENEKEHLLVQNLMGKDYNSISFQEQGLTMDESVIISKKNNKRKWLIIAGVIGVAILLFLIVYLSSCTNSKNTSEKNIAITTTEKSMVIKESIVMESSAKDTESNTETTKVSQTTEVQKTTKKKRKKKSQVASEKTTQEVTTMPSTKSNNAYINKSAQPSSKKVNTTNKPAGQKKDSAIDFENVVE